MLDFGLANCVYLNKNSDDKYEMSGFTGSLRYMAPEVALRQPYNEKADVYSYGILIWQMASDRMPFADLSLEQFMQNIVMGGERPEIDKAWPPRFQNILRSCFEIDPKRRPSFEWICAEFSSLLNIDSISAKKFSSLYVNNAEKGPRKCCGFI